jgi:hypothetical protein
MKLSAKAAQNLILAFVIVLLVVMILFKLRQSGPSQTAGGLPKAETIPEPTDFSNRPHALPSPTPGSLTPNYEFSFPFLGKVRCYAQKDSISFKTTDGRSHDLSMNLCYLLDGRCIRAEFEKEGAKVYEFPPEELEIDYQSNLQKIVGIPDQGPNIPMGEIISKLRVANRIEKATRLNITYAILSRHDTPTQAVFIVNVWGVEDSFFRDQDDEGARKARYVFDAAGKLLFFDNVL